LRSGAARNDGDAALYAYALIGPAVIDGDRDEVIRLMDILQKRCPFLMLHAVILVLNACDCWGKDALCNAVMAYVVKSGIVYSNRPCKLCEVYMQRDPDLKGLLVPTGGEDQLIGPDDYLRLEGGRLKKVLEGGR